MTASGHDVCTEMLQCSAQIPDYAWVSAVAAIVSALSAAAGLYYSHKAKDQTVKQACRETFDRMHGESFNALYKEIDSQFQMLRVALLSKNATKPQIANITQLAKAMPTDQLKKICTEIDPSSGAALVDTADRIVAEVSGLVGTVSMQNTGWYEQANDAVQHIQSSLSKVRNQAYAIRSTFIPPELN